MSLSLPHADVDGDAQAYLDSSEVSLITFHQFSPTLRTLRLFSAQLKCSQIFDPICSLLLEDLTLIALRTPNDDDFDVGGLPTETPPPSQDV